MHNKSKFVVSLCKSTGLELLFKRQSIRRATLCAIPHLGFIHLWCHNATSNKLYMHAGS